MRIEPPPRRIKHPRTVGAMLRPTCCRNYLGTLTKQVWHGFSTCVIHQLEPGATVEWRIKMHPTATYSRTKIFFFAHMSLRIFGHTVTLHSPRCALWSRYM